MTRESFYTDREFMIKESKEDEETPLVNDWSELKFEGFWETSSIQDDRQKDA